MNVAVFQFQTVIEISSLGFSNNYPLNYYNVPDVLDPALRNSEIVIYVSHDASPFALSTLREIKTLYPSKPVIVLSDKYHVDLMLWALRCSVWDYIVIPDGLIELRNSIDRFTSLKITQENREERKPYFPNHSPFIQIINKHSGKSTEQAISYIVQNYQKNIKVEKLAVICKLSPDIFSRTFKKEHGCSVREYLKSYRIETAKCLLRETSITIEEIAFETGFNTVSLFNRLFRENSGLVPSEYRKAERNPRLIPPYQPPIS